MGAIIAFTGTHGVGKTTAAFAMAAVVKKTCPGDVGMVQELARECPLPIYRGSAGTTREGQLWLFSAQIRAELEAVSRYDLVVCDRTCVDAIAYTSVAGYHDMAFGMLKLARLHVGLYERVIFLGVEERVDVADDGFRHQNESLRMEVQWRLLELYGKLGVKVERKAIL